MVRGLSAAVVAVLVLALAAGGAVAAPAPRPERNVEEAPAQEPLPGETHDDPFSSPHGFASYSSHGDSIAVNVTEEGRKGRGRLQVRMNGLTGSVTYTVPANLAGGGIHADLGRFGRVNLRWVPDGRVREVRTHCGDGFQANYFYATGAYVGTLELHGGDDFTALTRHRIAWRRNWFGGGFGCPQFVSEGFPGAGAILEAGPAHGSRKISLFVVQNGAGEEVAYDAAESEMVGRIAVSRAAFVSGGQKTITVGPGFRTGEISPPAPFSGTGRFERTEGARGTWLGDLSVEFPDHTQLRLAGKSFEATFHSGYYEVHGP